MRDYGKVSPQFWTGRTGRKIRALGAEAQVVAIYLMTCPGSSMIGLYYLPLPILAHETGIPLEGASQALRRLSEAGFAEYDDENEIVLVPTMARHQIGERIDPRDKRHLGVIREAEKLTYSRLFARWFALYREPYSLPEMRSIASPSEAPPKPLPSQEQEQEHAQEKEHLSLAPPSASPPPALTTVATPPTPSLDLVVLTPKSAKPKRTPKPPADPPPFSMADAFDALASTASGRFAAGVEGDWTKGVRIAVAKSVRQYPDLDAWRLVGAWLAAGGDAYRSTVGPSWAASAALPDAMARAREWDARGRGAISPRHLAVVEPPVADAWTTAAARAGVRL